VKLKALNLSQTKIDSAGLVLASTFPELKQVWTFDTTAEPAAAPSASATAPK